MRKLFPLLLILLTSCATSLQLYDIDFPEYTDIENSTIWVDASEDPLGLSAIVAEDLGYYGFNAYSVADKEDIGLISSSTGTAFAISSDILITNSHVVGDADSVTVVIDGKDVEAEVICNERAADVAVLRVPVSLPYSFIFADSIDKGAHVNVLAYPYSDIMGKEVKLTEGIINSLSGIDGTKLRFQFSAEIQPGNSGGPVFNDDFMVVGMATTTLSDTYTFENDEFISQDVNYAVKGDIIRYIAESLITHDSSYSVDTPEEAANAVFMVKTDEKMDISDDIFIKLSYEYGFNLRGWNSSSSPMAYFVDPIIFTLYTADGSRIGEIEESSYAGYGSVSETARDTVSYVARHIFYTFADQCLPRSNTGERTEQ